MLARLADGHRGHGAATVRAAPSRATIAAMPASNGAGPLAGLRVIDASTVLAGPYCTMLLADLGADVIKVEPPEGDGTRAWGPPWVGDEAAGTRTAAYYLAVNRNKRSVSLDLRQPEGAEVLRRLLADGDVFVENFRHGALDRLGFDDARLRGINPALVHLAISGYGTDGAAADRPGYDFVIQAVSGLMSITGAGDETGGGPTKVGVAISDVVTGMLAAVGILAALLERRSSPDAEGQRIDVSLLGATLATLVNQAQNAFVTGAAPRRRGNAHPNIVPYETFPTADGELAVAVGSERQWHRFCEAIGLRHLASDPRFVSNGDRVEHRVELRPILAARFAERPTTAWLATLEAADVPCGPILDVVQAFASPEAEALGMTETVEHPALGVWRQAGIPFRFERTPASIRSAPPLLGEHTEAILREVGYAPDEIAELRESGAIRG
jgi:crotonobetainyl-CoA:carnitine CoA-transferase CaiB-like acyl-CoA transferase